MYPSLDAELYVLGIKVEELATSRQVRRAYALVERLKQDPTSTFRAELLGNPDLFGWGVNEYLTAALVNAANTQIKGKKLTAEERITPPQPKQQKKPTQENATASDLAAFFNSISN